MNYFDEDFLNFFKELAGNNHKDWFDANRKRYETVVKKPFEDFVNALIERIQKHDKSIQITHKEAIFRINRDIRFSKDKSPYKINRSAIISPNGRKDKAFPGLYIETNPEHFRIYGGVYQPDKEQLYNIREALSKNQKKVEKLLKEKSFVELYGELRGERNKIVKDFKEEAEKFDLIYHKQFYWFTQFEPEIILDSKLMDTLEKAYLAQKPVMDFFAKAM